MKLELVKSRINPPISLKELEKVLPKICDKETSQDPNGWTPTNPLWGHCAVVSLVAQNLFGGNLLRASLQDTEFAHMRSHYWNKLADGSEEDFTKPQFGEHYPQVLKAEPRDRSYVLQYIETAKRYKLLALRLAKTLNNDNPLFDDPIYRACFETALESECQKMKFGCVITHDSKIVYQGANKTIEALRSLCEQECIRFSIQSRTEQMLGACGHAEELGLWAVAKKKIPLDECELYIAGVHPNGLPWIKKEPEHTCLRCSTQMYNADVKKIFVPVVDKWIGITPKEALDTAIKYATKEKAVTT